MKNLLKSLPLILFLLLLAQQFVQAQVVPQKATGIVLEPSVKQPISNARVVLTNLETYEVLTQITNENGNFTFDLKDNTPYKLQAVLGDMVSEMVNLQTAVTSDANIYSHILMPSIPQISTSSYKSNSLQPSYVSNTLYSENHLGFNLENVSFRVDVGTYAERIPISSTFLKRINGDVEVVVLPTGQIRYLVGNFSDYQHAKTYCSNLNKNGYRNARLFAFIGEKQLDLEPKEVEELKRKKEVSR